MKGERRRKRAVGYLVEEGLKNLSAQRPSTTQIFSVVMSLSGSSPYEV